MPDALIFPDQKQRPSRGGDAGAFTIVSVPAMVARMTISTRPTRPDAPSTASGTSWAHTSRYAFMPQARLARDAGVSKSAVSRLVLRQCVPSYPTVAKVAAALERELGRPVDPRDVVSLTPVYSTPTACDLPAAKAATTHRGSEYAHMFGLGGS